MVIPKKFNQMSPNRQIFTYDGVQGFSNEATPESVPGGVSYIILLEAESLRREGGAQQTVHQTAHQPSLGRE